MKTASNGSGRLFFLDLGGGRVLCANPDGSDAKTIVSESRTEFATLRYYWRDRPEQVLWWRAADMPDFDLKQALTQSSPEPVLFVTGCASLGQVRQVYANIEPLGAFAAPIGKLPANGERVYHAFKLSGARGPIRPFEGC